jgi:hypothetical protein
MKMKIEHINRCLHEADQMVADFHLESFQAMLRGRAAKELDLRQIKVFCGWCDYWEPRLPSAYHARMSDKLVNEIKSLRKKLKALKTEPEAVKKPKKPKKQDMKTLKFNTSRAYYPRVMKRWGKTVIARDQ